MVIQAFGVFAITSGLALLWTPWALIVGGLLMVLVPEIREAARR